MKKPLIGITTAEIKNLNHPWMPPAHGQLPQYVDAVARAGGLPILLPIVEDVKLMREYFDRCDGLLFAGGEDMDPAYYHETRSDKLGNVSAKRDTHEFELITWALDEQKPLLGVCRGMQVLNIASGGNVYQDIDSELKNKDDHESSAHAQDMNHLAHKLKIQPNSRLAKILDTTSIKANSRHHQAVKKLGKNLQAVAWSEDGLIEAIESIDQLFVLGIQSHPEAIEGAIEPVWQKVFTAFVAASKPAKIELVA